ncbi:hypothetical protein H257_14889 [Aphanomyces astaci]|uniref:Uncharacterized protein n=1 Tax=Aphanomyces astaci TaxID=112090 RepID=W4FQL4_APHAT|nr:hypothetical protein H257_14889 [Aphanomyces astaci]ETV69246.1 hypothetical protein H257_14889 [Aphanomyces astaci]|eukprot:XP_009841103.1 hypothetical protein H257_14889 [Aphanomyces astaci]
MGRKDRKQILWTDEMDEALLKEVVRLGPFEVGHDKVTATWAKAAVAMHEYDPNLSGCICQARCDTILHDFARDIQASMRASGVYEDDDDMTMFKQDLLDMREYSKSKRTRKRENALAKHSASLYFARLNRTYGMAHGADAALAALGMLISRGLVPRV